MKQHKEINQRKKEDLSWLYSVSKCAPQEALRDLDTAFKKLRSARAKERRAGFPRFKKRGRCRDSFRLTGKIRVTDRRVRLPRIGWVRTKESTAKLKGRILNATVSREADRWFVSFAVERERPDPTRNNGDVVGVDLGLTDFAVLSDGTKVQAPKPLRKHLKRLQRLSRQHARKQKGSKNRAKAALQLARLHRKIRNIRNDFLHKLSTDLTKTKSMIVIENLHVAGMIRNRKLSRAISDASWGEFSRQLRYKAKWYGCVIGTAGRFFPSTKLCSVCEYKMDKLPLSVREWTCPVCGAAHDRDVNAARNLRKLGLRNFPTGSSPGSHACGDPSAGVAVNAAARHGSTKQESHGPLRGSRRGTV